MVAGMRRRRKRGKSGRLRQIRLRRIEDDNHCEYCGCEVDEFNSTLDHIVPLSKGGGNEQSNLALSCKACNLEKGNKMPATFGKK